MTKRVQLIGHIHEDANAFTGEDREVTVDNDNHHIRLHDSVTPGGWWILNRDENDARYQERSVELDGLIGFGPSERGILVRRGPSNYALRALTVNEDNLAITNPLGYDGDLLVTIAPIILSDHQVDGLWTFSSVLTGDGGFVGNLLGDSSGTHFGNVIGNVTGNLTGNATGNHLGSMTGDLDVRGNTLLMDDETIQLSWLSQGILDYIIALGSTAGDIKMFSGAEIDIPAGWFKCDGLNGTPNLSDKFVIASGPTYPAASTGGVATHNHALSVDSGGAHVHAGSASGTALSIAQLPVHKHANGITDAIAASDIMVYGTTPASPGTTDSTQNDGTNGDWQGWTSEVGGGDTHDHVVTIDSSGAHVHTGSATDSSSLPPYYSLLFIMKGF